MRTAWPIVLSIGGTLPVLAARAAAEAGRDPTGGAASAGRSPSAVAFVVVALWVRKRDDLRSGLGRGHRPCRPAAPPRDLPPTRRPCPMPAKSKRKAKPVDPVLEARAPPSPTPTSSPSPRSTWWSRTASRSRSSATTGRASRRSCSSPPACSSCPTARSRWSGVPAGASDARGAVSYLPDAPVLYDDLERARAPGVRGRAARGRRRRRRDRRDDRAGRAGRPGRRPAGPVQPRPAPEGLDRRGADPPVPAAAGRRAVRGPRRLRQGGAARRCSTRPTRAGRRASSPPTTRRSSSGSTAAWPCATARSSTTGRPRPPRSSAWSTTAERAEDPARSQRTAARRNTRNDRAVMTRANAATTARLSQAIAVVSDMPQMSCRPRPEGSTRP